jgi:ribosomal protein L44E
MTETKTKRGKKPKRRHKYCPVCKEEVPMSVTREAEGADDLYWLECPSCSSSFALTSQQYYRKKRPKISAIRRRRAKIYYTSQEYSVGETIYHNAFNDVGLVVDKASAPFSSCSGAIIVSFMEVGEKTLIEGYTGA